MSDEDLGSLYLTTPGLRTLDLHAAGYHVPTTGTLPIATHQSSGTAHLMTARSRCRNRPNLGPTRLLDLAAVVDLAAPCGTCMPAETDPRLADRLRAIRTVVTRLARYGAALDAAAAAGLDVPDRLWRGDALPLPAAARGDLTDDQARGDRVRSTLVEVVDALGRALAGLHAHTGSGRGALLRRAGADDALLEEGLRLIAAARDWAGTRVADPDGVPLLPREAWAGALTAAARAHESGHRIDNPLLGEQGLLVPQSRPGATTSDLAAAPIREALSQVLDAASQALHAAPPDAPATALIAAALDSLGPAARAAHEALAADPGEPWLVTQIPAVPATGPVDNLQEAARAAWRHAYPAAVAAEVETILDGVRADLGIALEPVLLVRSAGGGSSVAFLATQPCGHAGRLALSQLPRLVAAMLSDGRFTTTTEAPARLGWLDADDLAGIASIADAMGVTPGPGPHASLVVSAAARAWALMQDPDPLAGGWSAG